MYYRGVMGMFCKGVQQLFQRTYMIMLHRPSYPLVHIILLYHQRYFMLI